jgi:predicted DNA-binding protein
MALSEVSSMWYHGGTVDRMAMTLRLSDEENQRLAELASVEGRSKQEILRLALADRWARLQKEQQLAEVLSRVLPRYQGLLDRIGTA